MKKLILCSLTMILTMLISFGQSKDELEIRRLETLWTQLLDKSDTTSLLKIWSKDYVVNNPNGKIATVADIIGLIRIGQSFPKVERIIEKITFTNNLAIVMGSEITENGGQKVTRRYTNVWQKSKKAWLLTARQSTNFLTQ